MSKKFFIPSSNRQSGAYFGWQKKTSALWGIKEGYKKSADDLVAIALESGREKTLDTYIFPILFLYRHSVEASLKLIYLRRYGKIPPGGHKLANLWETVYNEAIKDLNDDKFVKVVKSFKENFIKLPTNDIDFEELKSLFAEWQNIDKNSDVWRYLIDRNGQLYFTEGDSIDYQNLQDVANYVYQTLDYIYLVVSEYLSS